jgi:hypothetical protein
LAIDAKKEVEMPMVEDMNDEEYLEHCLIVDGGRFDEDEEDYDYGCDGEDEPEPNWFGLVEDCAGDLEAEVLEPILLVSPERLLVRDRDGWFKTVAVYYEPFQSGSYWEPADGGYWVLDHVEEWE